MQSNSLIKSDKIKDLKDDDPIFAVIRYIVTLLGVNMEKHDKLVFDVILSTIKRNFSGLTLEEIKEAFHLAISGNLDIKSEEIPHYQKFSSLYVSNILLSFKRYRIHNKRIKPIESPVFVALTFDESRAHTNETFEKHQKGEPLNDVRWTDIYNFLKKDGKISFAPEEVKPFQEKVREELLTERRAITETGKNAIAHDLILQWEDMFYCECRKRAVLTYFYKIDELN